MKKIAPFLAILISVVILHVSPPRVLAQFEIDCNKPQTFLWARLVSQTLTQVTMEFNNYSGRYNDPACTGNIGIAAMVINSGNPFSEIVDQTFFAGHTTTIGPGSTKVLTVDLPFCQGVGYQVDGFFGPLLNPYGPDYYDGRFMATARGQKICDLSSPPPYATPTYPTPAYQTPPIIETPPPVPSPSPSPVPIICAFSGPTTLRVGELGEFISQSTGNITSQVWTTTDGIPLSGLNSTFNWTPALAGIQTITLTISGPAGEEACTVDVATPAEPSPSPSPLLSPSPSPSPLVSPTPILSPTPAPLSCAFSGPTILEVGQIGSFTSLSTGNITSWVWTTTDGVPLSKLGSSISWTPALAGIQTITLTISGPAGEEACTTDLLAATTASPSLSPSPSPSPSLGPSPINSPSSRSSEAPGASPLPSNSAQGGPFIPTIPKGPPVTGRLK